MDFIREATAQRVWSTYHTAASGIHAKSPERQRGHCY